MVKMEAKSIYDMLGDSEAVRRSKHGGDVALSDGYTEKDILNGIDYYLQLQVREYRESEGKERDITVERNAAKIIMSLMGYESEGGDPMRDMDEVEEALNYLISEDVISTAIAEQNDGLVDRLYEKAKEKEEEEREMGE